MYDMMGWLGALLLAICAIPLTLEALIRKKVQIQSVFLLIWFAGEVLMFLYVIPLKDVPLLVNYLANIILLLPVMWVKFGRRKR